MSLRIIAGTLGGRRFEAPKGRATRPTPERVREAWFSALGPDVLDATVVDLFAGSGALGIEALSRGAGHVHFVETERRALVTLRTNLAALGLGDRSTVVARDALRFARGVETPFEVALADPPYDSDHGARLVGLFREHYFSHQLWLEHAPSSALAETADWTRRYGDTQLSRFRTRVGPDEGRPHAEPDLE